MGKHGTYVFTKKELERALDRENFGVKGEVLPEGNFAEITDEWYQADLTEGIRACEDVLKEPHAYGIQAETPEGRKRYRMVEQDLKTMKRKRCFKHRVDVRKVFGSTCDDCPKQAECY